MAPAEVALMPSSAMRSSSSSRSSTPQVKAPCAPPPCRARFTVFVPAAPSVARRVFLPASTRTPPSISRLLAFVSWECRDGGRAAEMPPPHGFNASAPSAEDGEVERLRDSGDLDAADDLAGGQRETLRHREPDEIRGGKR